MSSLLQEVGTPCPRRSRGSRASEESGNGSDSFDSLWDDGAGDYDDTRNLEFTTEIRPPILTGAKPKRRAKTNASFTIHSDQDEKPAQTADRPKKNLKPAISTTTRKSSLLAQPAQRFRPRVSFAPSPLKHSQQRDEIEPKKRSTGPNAQRNNDLLKRISGNADEAIVKDALKKDVRRNTVYIPPEDTTVASVFMGLFSPLKSNKLEDYTSENTQVGSLESQIARKKQAKRLAASSPGRAALQPSSKIAQETAVRSDIPGRNGGKENLPPGMAVIEVNGKKLSPTTQSKDVGNKLGQSKPARDGPGTLPRANGSTKPLATRTVNKPVKRVASHVSRKKAVSDITEKMRSLDIGAKSPATRGSTLSNSLKSSRSVMSSTECNSLKRLNHQYPLDSGAITNPAMYDDNWLSHQEVILTQLINGLFGNTDSCNPDEPAILRHEFLLLYQGAYFTNLYKRLQASLMYGALSIPQNIVLKNSRLRQDLGMKRRFIDIWLQTYEPNALRAALETVTGRVIPATTISSSNFNISTDGVSSQKERASTRRLEKFLDAFLVQNQDMDRNSSEFSTDDRETLAAAYRRTVHRSIMLVILLDKARECSETSFSRCLFLSSSPYKSSLAVLQALTRFLLPSCGDVGKAVAQIDCQLTYEQRPLGEYGYKISNLAVDLRDGVRLTRVVELLLYPPTSSDDCQWPLSRQLKFPCLGRAVKVFNVKTALDALASTDEGRQLVSNIRAAEIVDGHREKTIALLWGLVSNWGLSGLVDMSDLNEEISQLRKRAILPNEPGSPEATLEHAGTDEPTVLLKQWASLVTQLRGLDPENLNANLADGTVYECILDEYERYILTSSQDSASTERKTTLEDRLRMLGCSTQFSESALRTKLNQS